MGEAVPSRVSDRTADAFYVKVLKEMSVEKKRALVGATKRRLADLAAAHGVDPEATELLAAQEELAKMVPRSKWGDRWFNHPISGMREPEKRVCWLTDIDPVETDLVKRKHQVSHHALLHLKATMTAVDRFFMQVRRGITLAKRAVLSSNTDRRLWFGKAPTTLRSWCWSWASSGPTSTTARWAGTGRRRPCGSACFAGRLPRKTSSTSPQSHPSADALPRRSRFLPQSPWQPDPQKRSTSLPKQEARISRFAGLATP